ncbi:hypothetical protein WISP_08594 [Willisornis vidua]|uniref:Uncharacterized protein n=1 Tax=Willisornis vidua TaxID=1566151 RepID=A0ABQ9DS60_9PASS|nr:hypothetical protein WISP_08594 [Willisornis vidua]
MTRLVEQDDSEGNQVKKDNKNRFYKYINNKMRGKENLHSLLDSRGNIVNQDKEKVEVLNTYFGSVFPSKTGDPQDNWPFELIDNDRKLNNTPKFQEDTVSDLLKLLECLLMTPSWEGVLICWKAGGLCRGIWTDLRDGLIPMG